MILTILIYTINLVYGNELLCKHTSGASIENIILDADDNLQGNFECKGVPNITVIGSVMNLESHTIDKMQTITFKLNDTDLTSHFQKITCLNIPNPPCFFDITYHGLIVDSSEILTDEPFDINTTHANTTKLASPIKTLFFNKSKETETFSEQTAKLDLTPEKQYKTKQFSLQKFFSFKSFNLEHF